MTEELLIQLERYSVTGILKTPVLVSEFFDKNEHFISFCEKIKNIISFPIMMNYIFDEIRENKFGGARTRKAIGLLMLSYYNDIKIYDKEFFHDLLCMVMDLEIKSRDNIDIEITKYDHMIIKKETGILVEELRLLNNKLENLIQ